jgi:hypothetical protein
MPKKPKPVVEKPQGVDITEKSLARKRKNPKAPIGSNGKPKRKVTKTRKVKLPKGFTSA